MINLNWTWFQRRWYEFRAGDGTYLRYFVSFFQFILLTYTLGVERFSFLEDVFSHLWVYAISFFVVYVPLAIVIGSLHRRKQLKKEYIIAIEQNQVGGYNAATAMEMSIWIMRNCWKIEPSKEYLEMMAFWKKIAGDWKPT